MRSTRFPLPFPLSPTIDVYRDSPEFGRVEKHWQLPMHILQSLFVARYNLRTDESDDVDIDCDEWRELSGRLLADHPACVFVYLEA